MNRKLGHQRQASCWDATPVMTVGVGGVFLPDVSCQGLLFTCLQIYITLPTISEKSAFQFFAEATDLFMHSVLS